MTRSERETARSRHPSIAIVEDGCGGQSSGVHGSWITGGASAIEADALAAAASAVAIRVASFTRRSYERAREGAYPVRVRTLGQTTLRSASTDDNRPVPPDRHAVGCHDRLEEQLPAYRQCVQDAGFTSDCLAPVVVALPERDQGDSPNGAARNDLNTDLRRNRLTGRRRDLHAIRPVHGGTVAGAWMMVLRGQGHADRAWVSTRSGGRGPDESDQKKMPQHALDSTPPSQASFANARAGDPTGV
jgi:hypothetical protein